MAKTTPKPALLILTPRIVENIIRDHIRDLQVEAEAGEFETGSIGLEFKENETWEGIDVPAVQVSVYFKP